MRRDYWSIIVQADGDGGDSAQRTGSAYALWAAIGADQDDRGKSVVDGFLYDLDKLTVAPGRHIRHPIFEAPKNGRYTPWYGNPDNFSRDQSVVLQAAMVLLGTRRQLKELVIARAKNFFLHFNSQSYDDQEPITKKFPDIPAPIEFAQFIRGLDLSLLKPLLYVLDLQLLTDLLFRTVNKRNAYDSDNMFLPVLLSSLCKYPTFIGKIAKKLYARTNAVKMLRAYHSEANGNNGNENLGELYQAAFEQCIQEKK